MNSGQNTILFIGGIVLVMNSLFPPHIDRNSLRREGRHWVNAAISSDIDATRLIISEFVAVGAIVTAVGIAGINKQKDDK